MMTQHKKRIYFAVMGLSGAALFVDRVLLGEASVTAPRLAAALPTGTAPGGAPAAPAAAPGIPEVPFPRQLPRRDAQSPVRDLFAPPGEEPADSGEFPEGGPRSARRAPSADHLSRDTFATQHRLQAVLVEEGLNIAVVGGRWLRDGDALGGCALIGISENQALFRCYDGDISLSIGDDPTQERR
ncbi:MAG: hypothetical protein HY763_08640 [Planctomycetes bacterium]|nr:hypothetical protein [Planctomycetota bacterium]